VSVSAYVLPDIGKYRQDNVTMTFTFADGSIGVVDYLANEDKSFPKERVEAFCGGKVAVLDDFRSLELWGWEEEGDQGRARQGWTMNGGPSPGLSAGGGRRHLRAIDRGD
jgi:hypothetical protein